jgi:hypothetical protein
VENWGSPSSAAIAAQYISGLAFYILVLHCFIHLVSRCNVLHQASRIDSRLLVGSPSSLILLGNGQLDSAYKLSYAMHVQFGTLFFWSSVRPNSSQSLYAS